MLAIWAWSAKCDGVQSQAGACVWIYLAGIWRIWVRNYDVKNYRWRANLRVLINLREFKTISARSQVAARGNRDVLGVLDGGQSASLWLESGTTGYLLNRANEIVAFWVLSAAFHCSGRSDLGTSNGEGVECAPFLQIGAVKVAKTDWICLLTAIDKSV